MQILNDLADHLITQGLATEQTVFLFSEPDFSELTVTADVIYALNVSTGAANPKWTRDVSFINFRSRGRSKLYIKAAADGLQAMFDELLGSPSVQSGNNVYSQFNASETPRFSGFYEGSEPIFTFTLLITTESLVDVGNRLTY